MNLELEKYLVISVPAAEVSDVMFFSTPERLEYAKVVYSKLLGGSPSSELFDEGVTDGRILVYEAPDHRLDEI